MKVERIICKEEDLNVVREMWEINHDKGWENSEWETIARRDTLEEAFAVATERGYTFSAIDKDLSTYRKFEERTIRKANYVYDSFDKPFGRYTIKHYYIF